MFLFLHCLFILTQPHVVCRRHLHHKSRKYSLQEGARGGGVAGGGVAGGGSLGGPAGGAGPGEHRVSIPSAEEPLLEADRDELTSHRSDDPRALRRHKIQPRVCYL